VSVQFDLFLHSAEVVAENELREALRTRNASEAQQKLTELRARDPDHKTLKPASTMIDALQAALPHDSNIALACLDRLEQEWAPAAKTLFDVEGQEILAPLWRAAGLALESIRFDPERPDRHASRAYLACGDWRAALRVTQAEPGCKNQPVLLERMARALWQTDRTARAVEQWFVLCWLAPAYFEGMIRHGRIPASFLLEHCHQAMNVDMEPELSVEWYPAWVMLHEPGLARSVQRRGADTGPERAFDLIKELLLSNAEQLALRRELRDIHPGLLHYYLHNRAQFGFRLTR
jgi:hypothetical protein